MTAMTVTEPAVFASLNAVLQSAIHDLRVNVLFQITGALGGGAIDLRIGPGLPVDGDDSTRFVFYEGNALFGDPNRWDSTHASGLYEADGRLTTDPTIDVVQVPGISGTYPERCMLFAELPLRAVQIVDASLEQDETCIGERFCRTLDESCFRHGASLIAFITLEDAAGVCEDAIQGDLCSRLAGADCSTPRTEWPMPPTSICLGSDCRAGCDPLIDCNAYEIRADISAGAVDIVPLSEVSGEIVQPCVPGGTGCGDPDAGVGP